MSTLLKISFLIFFGIVGQMAHAQEVERGLAKVYSDNFQTSKMSSLELYDANKLTAAHRTLPFGTEVEVTNMTNGKSVVVRINDRGPFVKGHIIDLSGKAADILKIPDSLRIADENGVQVKLVVKGTSKASSVTKKTTPAKKTPPPPKKTTPAKTAKKTATRSLGISSARGYGVQVGSYASEANALKRVEALKAQWFSDIHIKKSKTTYKVILKNYETKEQAEAYLVNLKKKGVDGFVVSMKK